MYSDLEISLKKPESSYIFSQNSLILLLYSKCYLSETPVFAGKETLAGKMEDLVINSYDLNGFNFNDISQLMQVRLLDEDYSNSEENGSAFFSSFF